MRFFTSFRMTAKVFSNVSPILVFTVVGKSMEPTFHEGEKVLVVRFLPLQKGNVAAIKDPRDGRLLLKRITKIGWEEIFVEGDNKGKSTDSRHFGWISKRLIVGKVIYPRR